MSTPLERIQNDMKDALRAGEKERLMTIRMLLAAMKNEKIELGRELEDGDFIRMVQRALKQRREASESYRAGDRLELAEKEEREAVILQGYLPAAVDAAELEAAVRALVAEQGLSGPKAMGIVMKAMLERYAGRTDGSVLQPIVRSVLS
jgi:uncharacterized protein YqeY